MEDSDYDAGALFLFYHLFHCVYVRDFTELSLEEIGAPLGLRNHL